MWGRSKKGLEVGDIAGARAGLNDTGHGASRESDAASVARG